MKLLKSNLFVPILLLWTLALYLDLPFLLCASITVFHWDALRCVLFSILLLKRSWIQGLFWYSDYSPFVISRQREKGHLMNSHVLGVKLLLLRLTHHFQVLFNLSTTIRMRQKYLSSYKYVSIETDKVVSQSGQPEYFLGFLRSGVSSFGVRWYGVKSHGMQETITPS